MQRNNNLEHVQSVQFVVGDGSFDLEALRDASRWVFGLVGSGGAGRPQRFGRVSFSLETRLLACCSPFILLPRRL